MSEPVKETVSKKGRPQGQLRKSMPLFSSFMPPDITTDRSRMNYLYFLKGFKAVHGFEGEIFGAGFAGNFPRGTQTALMEAGRWIHAGGAIEHARVAIMDARKRGIPWADIRTYYRNERLGQRQGKSGSLSNAITRTIEEYRKRFPLTDRLDIGNGLALAGLPYADMHK